MTGAPEEDAEARVKAAYAGGYTTFMGLELRVAPGALVPREETELLGRAAAEKIEAVGGGARVVDMCCGSGNLACAIASLVPAVRVWASDLTDGCVSVARANVEHLNLGARVSVHQGDLFAGLAPLGLEGSIDVIVCNPPYISTGKLEKDRKALLDTEPREAFDGGPYGLSIHQRVIKDAPSFLRPGGWLLFEIGLGQERQVDILFKRASAYDAVEQRRDGNGNVRVILARTKQP
jgi:release factor glutamine methyltransferase